MFTRIDIARCRIDSDVDVLSIFLPTDINIYRSEPTACRISRTPALKDYNGAHQLALQLALQPNAAVTKAGAADSKPAQTLSSRYSAHLCPGSSTHIKERITKYLHIYT
ncbi:hypothetical protein MJO28_013724 [Puccinia striiformis f. sp. tritici]|uniref:Uncharacterized protein n=1 Tax=Puccinia striiformis f. sp. tritici TaxID=168172 RepID=A0ACC0DX06_9BASI|nr:hypothetical protein MJO28_013724 [Puccinia striiformis f. sp. tritici]